MCTISAFLTRKANFERLFVTGVVTSPNYPGYYSFDLNKTYVIQVEQGHVLSIHFTAFDVQDDSPCIDFLTITDGNGEELMEASCGDNLPADLTSTSNVVKLLFHTDEYYSTRSGWSLNWTAVTPGEKPDCMVLKKMG